VKLRNVVYFNDHPNVNPMLLAWFYHFASEETLGAVAALSVANPSGAKSIPHRVIIPWVEAWRDPYGLNEAFGGGVWGKSTYTLSYLTIVGS
jgi:hypothetical protein